MQFLRSIFQPESLFEGDGTHNAAEEEATPLAVITEEREEEEQREGEEEGEQHGVGDISVFQANDSSNNGSRIRAVHSSSSSSNGRSLGAVQLERRRIKRDLWSLNIAAVLGLALLWVGAIVIMNPRLVDSRDFSGSSCAELVGNLHSGDRRQQWDAMHCDEVLGLQQHHVLSSVAARAASERASRAVGSADTVVAVVTSSTSRGQGTTQATSATLAKHLFPSFASTAEQGFIYWLYVAYDAGDSFFDTSSGLSGIKQLFKDTVQLPLAARGITAQLFMMRFPNRMEAPGPAFNFALRAAYEDGADYMYRVNDDTWMDTRWALPMVKALQGMTPPNLGVVGPASITAHSSRPQLALLTHDMTHRTHLDIFGTHYYPPIFASWWLDDWVTQVYGGVLALPTLDASPAASGKQAELEPEQQEQLQQVKEDRAKEAWKQARGSNSSIEGRPEDADVLTELWTEGQTEETTETNKQQQQQAQQQQAQQQQQQQQQQAQPKAKARAPVTIRQTAPRMSDRNAAKLVATRIDKPTRARVLPDVVVIHNGDNRRYTPSHNPRHVLEQEVVRGVRRIDSWLHKQVVAPLECPVPTSTQLLAPEAVPQHMDPVRALGVRRAACDFETLLHLAKVKLAYCTTHRCSSTGNHRVEVVEPGSPGGQPQF